ncbi:hypothetical protein ACTFIY_011518 [Dictyostelium cf. discoideum]
MQTIKCVVIGDTYVGKTSLLITYTTNNFPNEYIPTIIDNHTMKINIDHEKQILLDLWDCASQSEYDLLRPKNYQNVNVFLICFSIISTSSFNNVLNKWNPECRHYSPNIPIILVATKLDKRYDKDIKDKLKQDKLNPISYEQGHTLMKRIKAIQYLECSALTKQGLKIVFDEAVKVALANEDPLENKKNNQTSNCIIF